MNTDERRGNRLQSDQAGRSGGIEVDRVGVRYHGRKSSVEAVREVSLSVGQGEFVALVGPSGCGKSTLLHAVAGLMDPTEGTVTINGRPAVDAREGGLIGLVQQDPTLLPWRTTTGNVMLLRELAGRRDASDPQRVTELLSLVGLTGFENAKPAALSGGMKQRVALARALALDPDVMLMDEPFAAVDEITRHRMGVELARIVDTANSTVLFITHSLPEAVFLADRVIMLTNRPARVWEQVEVPFPRPRTAELRAQPAFTQLVGHLEARLLEAIG